MDTTVQDAPETSERLALVPVDVTAEDVRVGDRIRIGADNYAVTRNGRRGEAVFFDLADEVFTIGFDEFEVVTVLRSYSRADVYGALFDLMRSRELPPPHSLSVKPGGDSFDVDVDVDTEDGFNRWAEALGMDAAKIRRSAPYKSHPGWRQRLSVSARSYTGPTWLGMDAVDLVATIDAPEPDPEADEAKALSALKEALADVKPATAQDAEQILATIDEPEPAGPTADEVVVAVLTPDAPELPTDAPRTWTIGAPQPVGVTLVDDPDGGRWRLGEVDWQCVNAPSGVVSWAQLLKVHTTLTEVTL